MAIDNRSTNTYRFYIDYKSLEVYPGVNLLTNKFEQLLLSDPYVQELMGYGIFHHISGEPNTYHDEKTDMTFIDRGGVKVPVTDPNNLPNPKTDDDSEKISTPTTLRFKAAELKKIGLSPEATTAIISGMPDGGYSSFEQIPNVDNRDKLQSFFQS